MTYINFQKKLGERYSVVTYEDKLYLDDEYFFQDLKTLRYPVAEISTRESFRLKIYDVKVEKEIRQLLHELSSTGIEDRGELPSEWKLKR